MPKNPNYVFKTTIIPKSLQEHFQCVVDKHIFIDKPWKLILREKIIENINSQNEKSCFWEFREELQNIQNEHVLIGHKYINHTDEEFVICLTDESRKYIENKQIQLEGKLKKRLNKFILKKPGVWESSGTEKEMEEMISVGTHEQLTFKWNVPTDRLQAEAKFEFSNSKSMRNQYVKLEPQKNEIFEMSERLLMDSNVQTTTLVNREMQTVPIIYQNQSANFVAVEEDMFQPQIFNELYPNLEEFLRRHVPNLEKQLHNNQVYDLYRDDYKLLKNKTKKSWVKCTNDVTLLPGAYHNVAVPQKYVSCHTWHPTIPGVFALTYITSSNGLYKTVNLEKPDVKAAKEQETLKHMDEKNNLVVIWSISDMIFPKLKLECFEEIFCIEFNPVDGNIVVGGLTNGQICIWDIRGKLDFTPRKDESYQESSMKYENLTVDVKIETQIKPAAFSAIFESHTSMVTAIQWVHPLNEITPLGQLVTMPEGRFSLQFFSGSLDGTIKLWDLHSTPLPDKTQTPKTKHRFQPPENLKKHKSPLSVYNNRLIPSYTITIAGPEISTLSMPRIIPITALSFEIPLLEYTTSNEPLIFGESRFEFVPTKPDNSERLLIVGTIMGQMGVVTWNGLDERGEGVNGEKCNPIWWGQVHDGPITCIRRNMFCPDVYLACGGRVASISNMNYKKRPLWYKEFNDFTNSVLWSVVHPAEFRVSFNDCGELQLWDFKKYTHRPCQTFNYNGLIATMSSPRLPVKFVDTQQHGMAPMDYRINELICFADSAGEIRTITIEGSAIEPEEEEKMDQMFRNEVLRFKELDRYRETYFMNSQMTTDDDDDDDDDSSNSSSSTSSRPEDVIRNDGASSYKLHKMDHDDDECYRQYLKRNPWSQLVRIRGDDESAENRD